MRRSAVSRFMDKLEMITESGCWVWMACCNGNGYGRFGLSGRTVYAHRFAFELLRGPIPPGLEIDHLCRVRSCVNPYHMEAVTDRVNTLRGESVSALHHRKSKCSNGHALTGDNVRIEFSKISKYGRRRCKQCARDYDAKKRALRHTARSGCEVIDVPA